MRMEASIFWILTLWITPLRLTGLSSSLKKNPNSMWNHISNHVFSQVGGLKFLLGFNYSIDKTIQLSNFHKQTLLAWSIIYKLNFSSHRYSIWNNKDILYKNTSLFFKEWFNNNIIFVSQLFNSNAVLISYQEFLQQYSL